MILAFILPIAGVIWLYIALLRFVLAPYVALFEPDVPVTKVLSRSTQLMLKGGQWFVVKGIGLILVISFAMSFLTGSNPQDLSNSGNTIVNLVMTGVSLLAGGAVVLLYRNRKMVKG